MQFPHRHYHVTSFHTENHTQVHCELFNVTRWQPHVLIWSTVLCKTTYDCAYCICKCCELHFEVGVMACTWYLNTSLWALSFLNSEWEKPPWTTIHKLHSMGVSLWWLGILLMLLLLLLLLSLLLLPIAFSSASQFTEFHSIYPLYPNNIAHCYKVFTVKNKSALSFKTTPSLKMLLSFCV